MVEGAGEAEAEDVGGGGETEGVEVVGVIIEEEYWVIEVNKKGTGGNIVRVRLTKDK
jgi:hypothetical protein